MCLMLRCVRGFIQRAWRATKCRNCMSQSMVRCADAKDPRPLEMRCTMLIVAVPAALVLHSRGSSHAMPVKSGGSACRPWSACISTNLCNARVRRRVLHVSQQTARCSTLEKMEEYFPSNVGPPIVLENSPYSCIFGNASACSFPRPHAARLDDPRSQV